MMKSNNKCIIVLGFSVTALSTLRCIRHLKKEGFKIILAGTDCKEKIAWYSNIPDKKFVFKDDLISGLLAIKDSLPSSKPLLLLTQDKDVVEISESREMIESFFTLLLSPKEVVETMMEKTKFTRYALSQDLSVPVTSFVSEKNELISNENKINYPVIVKPYLVHATKVFNKQELRVLIDKLESLNYKSLIVQEYIEGNDDNLFFCFLLFDHAGKLVHKMIAQKLRQWPVSYGTTSLAKTTINIALERELDKFITSTELKGFCSIEYKYDQIRDKFFIMEPTIGRFNQQVALTAKSGVNFPIAMVKVLLGQQVGIIKQTNEVYWIYESNDIFSYFKSPKNYGYFRIFFKPHINVLFSLSDPLPIINEIQMLAKKKLRKLVKHV